MSEEMLVPSKTCAACRPLGECPFVRSVRKIDQSMLPNYISLQEKIYVYNKALGKNCERAEEILPTLNKK